MGIEDKLIKASRQNEEEQRRSLETEKEEKSKTENESHWEKIEAIRSEVNEVKDLKDRLETGSESAKFDLVKIENSEAAIEAAIAKHEKILQEQFGISSKKDMLNNPEFSEEEEVKQHALARARFGESISDLRQVKNRLKEMGFFEEVGKNPRGAREKVLEKITEAITDSQESLWEEWRGTNEYKTLRQSMDRQMQPRGIGVYELQKSIGFLDTYLYQAAQKYGDDLARQLFIDHYADKIDEYYDKLKLHRAESYDGQFTKEAEQKKEMVGLKIDSEIDKLAQKEMEDNSEVRAVLKKKALIDRNQRIYTGEDKIDSEDLAGLFKDYPGAEDVQLTISIKKELKEDYYDGIIKNLEINFPDANGKFSKLREEVDAEKDNVSALEKSLERVSQELKKKTFFKGKLEQERDQLEAKLKVAKERFGDLYREQTMVTYVQNNITRILSKNSHDLRDGVVFLVAEKYAGKPFSLRDFFDNAPGIVEEAKALSFNNQEKEIYERYYNIEKKARDTEKNLQNKLQGIRWQN